LGSCSFYSGRAFLRKASGQALNLHWFLQMQWGILQRKPSLKDFRCIQQPPPPSSVIPPLPMNGGMRPKGSAKKLEARRRMAAGMLAKGRGIREVARTIGAAPSSVKRWKDAIEKGGKNALKSKPHTGRPSRLSAKQRQSLLQILQRGPRAAKLRADQWTCSRVGTVIRRCFGVKYHPDHVSRILRALGWKYKGKSQRPQEWGTGNQTRARLSHLARRHR